MRKSIGAPRKAMKALFTNQVITASFIFLCKPMAYPSFSRSTEVFRFIKNVSSFELKAAQGSKPIIENTDLIKLDADAWLCNNIILQVPLDVSGCIPISQSGKATKIVTWA